MIRICQIRAFYGLSFEAPLYKVERSPATDFPKDQEVPIMTESSPNSRQNMMLGAMPVVFVFLWSTGFIGAKLGLPYVEPMTFLGIRFAICVVLFLPVVFLTRTRWPSRWQDWGHIGVSGILMHGGYLGFIFWAISLGVPAGTSALIAGIQPLIVAALAGLFLKEIVSGRQWIGLLAGLFGVFLVVADKIALGQGSLFGIFLCFLALFSIAFGTLYQKKFCTNMSLKSGNFIQFLVATVYFTIMAMVMEERTVIWSGELVFALTWLVLVLSLGAVSLLYVLLRNGAASKVSSLFYLVPPCTAVVAYLLFDEKLSGYSFAGMAIAILGVAIVNLKTRKVAP